MLAVETVEHLFGYYYMIFLDYTLTWVEKQNALHLGFLWRRQDGSFKRQANRGCQPYAMACATSF